MPPRFEIVRPSPSLPSSPARGAGPLPEPGWARSCNAFLCFRLRRRGWYGAGSIWGSEYV
jgi:hypothetical protein